MQLFMLKELSLKDADETVNITVNILNKGTWNILVINIRYILEEIYVSISKDFTLHYFIQSD